MLLEIVDVTICYGRSVVTIAEQLFGKDTTLTTKEKQDKAQRIYDSVLTAFPQLRALMIRAQKAATDQGYVETILGRRRHIPDMQLPEFEFVAMKGYVNPDVDPLDITTLDVKAEIPERIVTGLKEEFKGYKYFGQIARRTKELYEQGIKVINNRPKITEASRKCVNCVDYETEILTTRGWLKHNEVRPGDTILSYSLDSHEIVHDVVKDVFDYPGETEAIEFNSPTFSAVSTPDHRWVVGEYNETPRIRLTRDIYKHKWPDYPIYRVADNSFKPNPDITDDQLKILGWIMTDGSIEKKAYAIHLYQSVRRNKNREVYQDMIATLQRAGVEVTDACRDGYYHEMYLKSNTFTQWVRHTFPNRVLTFDFVSTLSQHQSEILLRAMLQGDGAGVDSSGQRASKQSITFCCKGENNRDVFQYLCFVAGYATNSIESDLSKVDYPSNHILYGSMTNIPASEGKYYNICVLRHKRAQIYPHHKHNVSVNGVWCMSSEQSTWIARRNGKVYITGNSIIQGSAAELTKMAILALESDPDWIKIGGRLLVPVHDELICEVPADKWKEGGEILSRVMCDAGSFLPFTISCDVTTTYRWYGLEYPCPYTRPASLNNLTEDEIKWLQYMFVELENTLPVFKNEDGSKPRGDAAVGVNGIMTEELQKCISNYKNRYSITTDEEFIQNIFDKVDKGEQ